MDPRLCTGHDCQGKRVVTNLQVPGQRWSPENPVYTDHSTHSKWRGPQESDAWYHLILNSLRSFFLPRASDGQLPFLWAPLTLSLLLPVS